VSSLPLSSGGVAVDIDKVETLWLATSRMEGRLATELWEATAEALRRPMGLYHLEVGVGDGVVVAGMGALADEGSHE